MNLRVVGSDGTSILFPDGAGYFPMFDVTECGALIVFSENENAKWAVAAFAPGQWRIADKTGKNA
jgi:hypothetical protein